MSWHGRIVENRNSPLHYEDRAWRGAETNRPHGYGRVSRYNMGNVAATLGKDIMSATGGALANIAPIDFSSGPSRGQFSATPGLNPYHGMIHAKPLPRSVSTTP